MTASKSAVSFAAAAALLALSGAATSTPALAKSSSAMKVECFGVNACKGQSDCKSAGHDCKGMNDCKGQGFKSETAKQCKADGGSLTAPK
ncbi:BufA2 family periplasmic bufferin-type metallophore [Novosphingobium terrae]|uniref:BufA2 family periplasmic bufferin-type metallophore n=1 Tax=Novosphingobium terrae TaxID=2726189 RepID=UPI0019808848|nr:hypothetical protein [Novosphingobium terrae]